MMLEKYNWQKDVTPSDIIESEKLRNEATRLHENGEFYQANKVIDEALNKNPQDVDNWNLKALILWDCSKSGNLTFSYDAYVCFNIALQLNPNDPTAKYGKSKFVLDWSIGLFNSKEFIPALKRINEYLEISDDKTSEEYAIGLNIKGLILYNMQSYNESIKYFNKALEIAPYDDNIRQNKKICIYDWAWDLFDSKQYNDAIEMTNKFLSMIKDVWSEEKAYGSNLMGCIYFMCGYYNEALQCFNEAWVIKPDDEEISDNRRKTMKLLNMI